jgi:hypothetical protein
VIASLVGAAGCSIVSDPFNGTVCTTDFRYGITVHVLDSLTNAPAASGAKLVAKSGTYADSTTGTFPGSTDALVAAGEHSGTFTVTITKAGYKDWVKTGVVVGKGECHVEPVTLTALLQK